MTAISPLAGLLTGFLASVVQTTYAPVGLFPMLVGIAVGALLGVLFRLSGGRGRLQPFVAATLGALACVAALHYFTFRHEKEAAAIEAEKHQKLREAIMQKAIGDGATGLSGLPAAPNTIDSFREYMAMKWDVGQKLGPLPVRGPMLLLWWMIDAVLLWVGAAVAALVIGGTPAAAAAATSSTPEGRS